MVTAMLETRHGSDVCRAGLVSLLAFVGLPACSSGRDLPAMAHGSLASTGGQGSNHAATTCSEGETRKCSATLAQHGSVLSCLYGTQTCRSSKWSSCEQGSVALMAVPVRGERNLSSISQVPEACEDNPCDPTCQAYEENPGAPLVAQVNANVGWWTGAMSALPQNVQDIVSKPNCETAADCQQNQHCVNVATASSCAHDKCKTGIVLDTTCTDSCVQAICAENPACCQTSVVEPCKSDEISGENGRCFYYIANPAAWEDSQKACLARGDGWNLACISSAAEQDWITERNHDTSWLGTKRITPGVASSAFYCVNGEQPLSTGQPAGVYPWDTGEPNNSGGEDCAEISSPGTWNDLRCEGLRPAWCEGPAPSAYNWNDACVNAVASVCGATCDTSGTNQTGTCSAWSPGQTNPNDANFDLSIDVPCNGQVPVCNHGTQPAPAGMVVHVFSADSAQNGSDAGTELGHCSTTETIAPGACTMVDGCSDLLLQDDAELQVEAPDGGESRTDDNRGYSVAGTACVVPHCANLPDGASCVTSREVKEDYLGTCLNTSQLPQWSFLQFQSQTPGDSTISIQIAAAATLEGLETAKSNALVTVSQAAGNHDCLLSGPTPSCPVDLYQALLPNGDANSAYIRLTFTLNSSSDGLQTPVLNNWRVSFACPDSM